MKHTSILLLLALSMSLPSSCAIQRLDDETFYRQKATWSYEHPYEKCLAATRAGLTQLEFPIEEYDKESGRVTSGRKLVYSFQDPVQSDPYKENPVVDYYLKYHIQVSGSNASCRIALQRMRVYMDGTETNTESAGFVRQHIETLRQAVERNL